MSDETQMEVLEERQVEFYGDTISAALVRNAGALHIFVPVKMSCEVLGLNWSPQRARIHRDEVLKSVVIKMIIPARDGKRYKMECLPLDYLHGWLFGITTSQVSEEHRSKITLYRRECFRVLSAAFQPQVLPATEQLAQPGEKSGAQLAYEIATAVQHLARQQLEMEQRLSEQGERLTQAAQWAQSVQTDLANLRGRVADLEVRVNPTASISEAQAAEIALAVKHVGYALEQAGKKPGYPRVYAELYRRYGISSYKNLPREQYDEVLAWLRAWFEEVEQS